LIDSLIITKHMDWIANLCVLIC